jgi:ketosteroid isomerase-like protein
VSAENVEIVRRLIDSFRRRDNEYPFTVFAEDIEWDASQVPIFDAQRVFRGHEGVRDFWRRWLQAWEDIEFKADEIVESGEDVAVFIRQRNLGHGSGIWVDQAPYVMIWTFRGGKAVRMRYRTPEEARAELGLEPG